MGDDGITTQDLTSQQKSTLEPSKSQLAKIAALEKEIKEKDKVIEQQEKDLQVVVPLYDEMKEKELKLEKSQKDIAMMSKTIEEKDRYI